MGCAGVAPCKWRVWAFVTAHKYSPQGRVCPGEDEAEEWVGNARGKIRTMVSGDRLQQRLYIDTSTRTLQ
jgi:hypothetical protein